MLDRLRKLPLLIAFALIALAVIVEAGQSQRLRALSSSASSLNPPVAGAGILSLAFLDSVVLFITLLIILPLVIPERIQGRIQGAATLIFSIVILIADIFMIFAAITLLIIMVSLLLAPIFGTLAYFVLWGSFNTGAARTTLAFLMTLKLLFALCLVLAQQKFLQIKSLVVVVLLSLLANFLVSFLHAFVPGPLVSITDDIAAIVVGIITAILGIILLINSIVSIVKAIL